MSDVIGKNADSGVADAGTTGRRQLLATLDGYLGAVVADDPSAVDVTEDFRETQNAVDTERGAGIWETATRVGTSVRYADPVTGEAGFYGILDEARAPVLAGLRVKTSSGRVREAEWILARVGMTFYNAYGFRTNLPRRQLPRGTAACPRETAIEAAKSYFDGIAASDGSIVRVRTDAYRVENGSLNVGPLPGEAPHTADRPAGDGVTSALAPGITAVTSNFDNLRNVTEDVVDRRFFYDEEAGVVWTHGTFTRVPGATRPSDGGPLPWLNFFELFQIEDDSISAIHAVMDYLPLEIRNPGWMTPAA